MILLPFASGKTYGVLGLGKSGRATVASLLASGARVVMWDDGEKSRTAAAQEFPGATLQDYSQWEVSSLAALVLSPGIFLTHPAVLAANKAGIEVIGDIELLYRAQPNATYVGITGTNGKSTTTTLIAHILKACGKCIEVGGNLGTPALALTPLDASGIYVLELSSYQLDLVRTTRMNVAILLNITPDHLDHHGSMENYIAAKMHIFDRQTQADVAIVGVDDAICEGLLANPLLLEATRGVIGISGSKVIDASRGGISVVDSNLFDGVFNFPDDSSEINLRGSLRGVKSLQGAHNGQNAAAAYAACMKLVHDPQKILAAMQTYPGLDHRMQWLGEIVGVQYVNDSKATNADAAEKALLTYENIYWIIGGVAKEGGIEPLAKYFPKIRHAYLIGEAADAFAITLEGNVAYTQCGTLEKAFTAASGDAKRDGVKGAVVLLSPACASFDQFPNFEVRGAAFVKLFESLKQGGHHGTPTA